MKKERKLMKYHGPHHGIDEGVWSVTPSSAYTIHDNYDHCMNEIFSFYKIYKIFRNKIKNTFRKNAFFPEGKKGRCQSNALSCQYKLFSAKIRILSNTKLNQTLSFHGINNLFKACNVCTCYEVAFYAITFCCIRNLSIDIFHDIFQLCIYFFK